MHLGGRLCLSWTTSIETARISTGRLLPVGRRDRFGYARISPREHLLTPRPIGCFHWHFGLCSRQPFQTPQGIAILMYPERPHRRKPDVSKKLVRAATHVLRVPNHPGAQLGVAAGTRRAWRETLVRWPCWRSWCNSLHCLAGHLSVCWP